MENENLKSNDYNGNHIEEDNPVDEDIENTSLLEEETMDLKVGMDFGTSEELYEYYGRYGNEKGFPVMKRSSKKGDDGIIRWVIFACGRSGLSESNSKNAFKMHPITKTNCSAKINATLCSDGRWRVTKAKLDHNHGLSPRKSRYYRRNRTMQPFVKRRLEMNDRAGIRPNKSFNSFVVEAGGHDNIPFLEKDCYNHLGKARRLRLGDGDAAAIQNYFTKMQANNSNFYYLLDLDEEARIKNVFWADARSRAAYEEFGEVITFDTTYLTNKYDMPFAPFVGVNHHGHSILLGCALISSEDTDTFIWVFKTWLECMGRRAPNAIITDQARAMQNAIEVVFPNTRHRWCLWHIMKKLPEKFGSYKDYESIKKKMKDAVYESLSTNEFEEKWNSFINEFNLHKNDWLDGLYIERRRWVPVFVKYIFWAGMSTTQRSESMNAFFDGYVNSKTTLKQFVEQYENALRSKAEKENQADFNSFNSWLPCITHFEIEKQFQGIYTTAKFKEFQNELKGKIYCDVESKKIESDPMVYEISEEKIGGMDRQNTFTVSFQPSDCEIKCNCRLFEFRGILCKHSIVVLLQQKVKVVPEKYILRRWRKDIKRSHTKVKVTYFDWMQNPENEQFDRLCNAFYQVADLATGNKDKVESVMRWIKKLRDDLIKCEGTSENSEPSLIPVSQLDTSPITANISPTVEEINKVHSPLAVPKRGRPPFKRKQSTGEQVIQKKKENKKVATKEKKKKTKTTTGNLIDNANSEETRKGGSIGSTQGGGSTLEELNDGYIGVELGMTQESITTKVPYRGSKAMDFDAYNVLQYGNVSSGNQPMIGSSCPNVFYGAGLPPYIQNNRNGAHVLYNGDLPRENEPTTNNGANYSLQTQGFHYPFWSRHDTPFGGI